MIHLLFSYLLHDVTLLKIQTLLLIFLSCSTTFALQTDEAKHSRTGRRRRTL